MSLLLLLFPSSRPGVSIIFNPPTISSSLLFALSLLDRIVYSFELFVSGKSWGDSLAINFPEIKFINVLFPFLVNPVSKILIEEVGSMLLNLKKLAFTFFSFVFNYYWFKYKWLSKKRLNINL